MENFVNPRLARLGVLLGGWELTTSQGDRVMSRARTTFRWLDGGRFLSQRTDPQTELVPEWEGLAPAWTDSITGLDDHSDAFTVLYTDSRNVCRVYAMTFDDGQWVMTSRPAADFHQRFIGVVAADATAIDGRWEASPDGRVWATDFDVSYRRLAD
ncbi:hypothetical protein [Jiangella mangrovi]|uniref:DUF1579 domain-containing protein n=1 Tax=Jiangella mangrovi TaxID=1524084 RepID=A0A7W9LKH0_9ACTN|nr:hypothetical protein [Jiangella mangrovi]MBB5787123.1 hypothetical protein [Jiangella mangrovi]